MSYILAVSVGLNVLLFLAIRSMRRDRVKAERAMGEIAEFLQCAGKETLPDGSYLTRVCMGRVCMGNVFRFAASIFGVVNRNTGEYLIFVCKWDLPDNFFSFKDGNLVGDNIQSVTD